MDAHSAAGRDLDEFGQDLQFQRRFWRAERIAWVAYVLLLVAALLGLTGGGGPLSHANAETPYGTIDYPQVSRWQAADDLSVRFAGGASEVTLGEDFVELFAIESIQPQPDSATATADGIQYSFSSSAGGAVIFNLRARRPAFFRAGAVRLGDAEVRVRPLILP